jgi:hypothetical protein
MNGFLVFLAVLITLCASYENQRRHLSGPVIRNVYHWRNGAQLPEGFEKRGNTIKKTSLRDTTHPAIEAQNYPSNGSNDYPQERSGYFPQSG